MASQFQIHDEYIGAVAVRVDQLGVEFVGPTDPLFGFGMGLAIADMTIVLGTSTHLVPNNDAPPHSAPFAFKVTMHPSVVWSAVILGVLIAAASLWALYQPGRASPHWRT